MTRAIRLAASAVVVSALLALLWHYARQLLLPQFVIFGTVAWAAVVFLSRVGEQLARELAKELPTISRGGHGVPFLRVTTARARQIGTGGQDGQ